MFLSVLEVTFTAVYLPPEQKVSVLCKAISWLDLLKFFLQIAWENKQIPNNKYLELSQRLEEIGRILGGWKKGIISKTPAK